jgi:hypothetical protein
MIRSMRLIEARRAVELPIVVLAVEITWEDNRSRLFQSKFVHLVSRVWPGARRIRMLPSPNTSH